MQCGNSSDASSCTYYKGNAKAQVWNWGYDAIYNTPSAVQMPEKICLRVWALDVLTGQNASLPTVCNKAPLTTFSVPKQVQGWKFETAYALSAEVATYLCTADYCRTDAHNSFDVSLVSTVPFVSATRCHSLPLSLTLLLLVWQADPTDTLTSVTHYSIDGGDWTSESQWQSQTQSRHDPDCNVLAED